MLRRSRLFIALIAGVAAAACSPARSAPPVAAPGGDRYALTEAELQSAQDRNLYDAIQRLRPTFLRSRQVRSSSTPNPEPVHVFVDGTRAEGLETLKLFSPAIVREVHFYEPHQANVRFGTGHHGGLIEVILRR
jgi:hypothetical protein